jgi:hypothetical protein
MGNVHVTQISGDAVPIKCDTRVPATVTHTFNCVKPPDKTVLASVNVEGKGALIPVEVYGMGRMIPDMLNDIKALSQAPVWVASRRLLLLKSSFAR